MKRFWIVVLVIALIIGGFFVIRSINAAQQSAQTAYQTEPLAKGSLVAQVGATGTVRSNQSTVVSWQTTGRIGSIAVNLDDSVTAGQALASLEESSLPQSVILARSDLVTAHRNLENLLNSELASANAQLGLAQAQNAVQDALDNQYSQTSVRSSNQNAVDAARAKLVLAQQKVDRAQDIYDLYKDRAEDDPQRASALQALAAARTERDSAQRSLNWLLASPDQTQIDTANAEVAVAQAKLKDAMREWERLKDGPDPADIAAAQARVAAIESTLGMIDLNAPFAGTITDSRSLVGDQVSPGTVSFQIDDLSHLLVDVMIPEVDINRIVVGQTATLSFDAIQNKSYNGTVTGVARVGTVSSGVVNFKVTIELTDSDQAVRPGMTAAVNIVVDDLSDVTLIPNRAVRLREGKRVVYVLRNGSPEPVQITLGASSESYSELLEGDLQIGDLVVLNPPSADLSSNPSSFMR